MKNTNYFPSARSLLIAILLTLILGSFIQLSQAETLVPFHIKEGTNLIHIARDYCLQRGDWKEIARINRLKAPYMIRENATLQIPLSILKVNHLFANTAGVRGTVYLMQDGKIIGPVINNDKLLPGQTVVTGPDGHVHLIFPDHKFTRIAPNSELTLSYILQLTDKKLKVELFLQQGRIIHSIKQKLKENESFKTRTPVSITGVRGTEYRIKMMDGDINITETLSGGVKMKAAGKIIALNKGEGSKVIKGKPPTPPRPLPAPPSPIQLKPVYRILPVVFPAPGHKDAHSYRLLVTSDEQGNKSLLEKQVLAGNDFQLEALEDGTYFCFLTAIDKDNFESLPAGPYPLYIRTVPAAPMLSAPKNNLVTWEKNLEIKWLQTEHTDHYLVEFSDDHDFQHLIDSRQTVEPFYTTPELQPGTYYFRVQAVASDGFASPYSRPLTWIVLEQTKFVSIAGSQEQELTIQWAADSYPATYDLQVARDAAFTDIVIAREGLTTPALTITEYLEPGDYSVRVRYVLSDGPKSPWAPPQVMTIEPGPLGVEHAILLLAFLAVILL